MVASSAEGLGKVSQIHPRPPGPLEPVHQTHDLAAVGVEIIGRDLEPSEVEHLVLEVDEVVKVVGKCSDILLAGQPCLGCEDCLGC
jgi:hypothetical protein